MEKEKGKAGYINPFLLNMIEAILTTANAVVAITSAIENSGTMVIPVFPSVAVNLMLLLASIGQSPIVEVDILH